MLIASFIDLLPELFDFFVFFASFDHYTNLKKE